MCLDILANPGKAFESAKKSKGFQKAWLTLVEAAVLLGLAAAVASFSIFGNTFISATAFVATLILCLVAGIILAWVIGIATTTLGGRGAFNEGLVALSYSLIFFSIGLLVAALLSWVPVVGKAVGGLVLLATAAAGLATLYRGIKEMFRTDMITAFVAVSVVVLALFIAVWATIGLSLTGGLNNVFSAVNV